MAMKTEREKVASKALDGAGDFGSVVELPGYDGNPNPVKSVPIEPGELDGNGDPIPPAATLPEVPQPPIMPVTVRKLSAADVLALEQADVDVAMFSQKWRGYEEARRRQRDRRQQPGDGILFAEVGQSQTVTEDLLRTEFARLTRIDNLLATAGSLADIEKARDVHQKAAARLDKTTRRVANEIAELNRKIAELQAEQSQDAADHDAALEALSVMSESREKLRDLKILPQHIVDEFKVREAFATNEVRADIAAIRQEIADLEIEAASTVEIVDGEPVNVHLCESRMNSIKADPNRTGYEFWKDRIFSMAEFGNYKKWCSVRLQSLRAQIEQLDRAIQAKIDASAEKLLGFYTDALE